MKTIKLNLSKEDIKAVNEGSFINLYAKVPFSINLDEEFKVELTPDKE